MVAGEIIGTAYLLAIGYFVIVVISAGLRLMGEGMGKFGRKHGSSVNAANVSREAPVLEQDARRELNFLGQEEALLVAINNVVSYLKKNPQDIRAWNQVRVHLQNLKRLADDSLRAFEVDSHHSHGRVHRISEHKEHDGVKLLNLILDMIAISDDALKSVRPGEMISHSDKASHSVVHAQGNLEHHVHRALFMIRRIRNEVVKSYKRVQKESQHVASESARESNVVSLEEARRRKEASQHGGKVVPMTRKQQRFKESRKPQQRRAA